MPVERAVGTIHVMDSLRPVDHPEERSMDQEVAAFMRPGCVVISDSASAADAARALVRHRAEEVLVVAAASGTPLGWVTPGPELQRCLEPDAPPATAHDVIREIVRCIPPHAGVRAATYALALPDTSRLLVREKGDRAPLGVVTEADLPALE